MSGKNVPSADNQQETLWYFSGFLTGEGSISVIKAQNTKGRSGYYFTPDITVSNQDRSLLSIFNTCVGNNMGVITAIKSGYNLSFRGKEKVSYILRFLAKFPPLSGDIITEKIALMTQAVKILSQKQSSHIRCVCEIDRIEQIRFRLRQLKQQPETVQKKHTKQYKERAVGYFLSGIVDAEGSMGLKTAGKYMQPFFSIAMKEKAIIELCQSFTKCGHIYYRPRYHLWHYETAKKECVLQLCTLFLEQYPVRIERNIKRIYKLKRILNDYTPNFSPNR